MAECAVCTRFTLIARSCSTVSACKGKRRGTLHIKVLTPCLRSLRFLRPKMRTLEKMSTRFPLHSPLFLLGLFLRRLVEGRSRCCSRACRFCLMSPLAIAAAMARNVTARGARTTQTAASHSPQPAGHSPMVATKCSVPWCRMSNACVLLFSNTT